MLTENGSGAEVRATDRQRKMTGRYYANLGKDGTLAVLYEKGRGVKYVTG